MIHLFLATLLVLAPPTAQQCFDGTAQKYNDDIANHADVTWFQRDYESFSDCARYALAQKPAPAWDVYFASAIGATYTQVQMAGMTDGDTKCRHYSIAKDTITQADQTLQDQEAQSPQIPVDVENVLGEVHDQIVAEQKENHC